MSDIGLDFTAIDFETANRHRGSVCAYGLVKVRDGAVVDELSGHVKPPGPLNYFDWFNTRLHGIGPEHVMEAPEWNEAFSDIKTFVGDDVLIAHNAAFERGVLSKACQASGLTPHSFDLRCSMAFVRSLVRLPSYSLSYVSASLGLEDFAHHDALADATAAARIVIRILSAHNLSGLQSLVRALPAPPPSHPGGAASLTRAEVNAEADPDGYLFGRTVVFTGALQTMTRQEAWDATTRVGGCPEKNPTKRTNVLVVGDVNVAVLSPGSVLTGKAKRAFELQDAGQEIEVMTEADFLRSVDVSFVSDPLDPLLRPTSSEAPSGI